MKKRIIVFLAVLFSLAATIFLAYNFDWTNLKANQTNSDIKVYAILPLSGTGVSYGKSAQEGYELAAELFNKDSSEISIDISFEDSRADPKQAVNAYYKITSQYDPAIIFGLITSPEVLSVAPLAERDQIVLFSSGASSPQISNSGDYIFRNVASDLLEVSVMAESAYKQFDLTRIGIMYVNNEYGIGAYEKFKQDFEKFGGVVPEVQSYNRDETNFRTGLQRIREASVDAIYLLGYKELGILVRQAREIGFEGKLLSNSLFEDPEILNMTGESSEGVIFSTYYFNPESDEPVIKHFVSNYEAKYGKTPDGFAVAAYDALRVVFESVDKKNEITAQSIKNSLYAIETFEGLLGDFRFDENGDVQLPIQLKTVRNNKFINLNN